MFCITARVHPAARELLPGAWGCAPEQEAPPLRGEHCQPDGVSLGAAGRVQEARGSAPKCWRQRRRHAGCDVPGGEEPDSRFPLAFAAVDACRQPSAPHAVLYTSATTMKPCCAGARCKAAAVCVVGLAALASLVFLAGVGTLSTACITGEWRREGWDEG